VAARRSSRRAFLTTAGALLGASLMPAEARGQGLLERRIPKTGEALPAVGLGTWQVFDVAGSARDLAQAKETLRVFVEGGGRMVDSSPMYGSSEDVTGRLAAELGARPKLFVATKGWCPPRARRRVALARRRAGDRGAR
jgi:aryl-alcohol dehydrogenase-like predicted oxidoreductase